MGNNSFGHTELSQNSTGQVDPYVLRALNSASRALNPQSVKIRWKCRRYSQSSNFKVIAIHDDVVEGEKDREPELDHIVIHRRIEIFWCRQTALGVL
jgi:hypothetical protein